MKSEKIILCPAAKPKAPTRRKRSVSRKNVRGTLLALLGATLLVGLSSWWCDRALLETRAKQGYATAQYDLGKHYFDVWNPSRDYNLGAYWIRRAAEHGHAKAQTGLGLLYVKGLGVRKDPAEAVRWLRKAAENEFAVAQNELGLMYAKGIGVKQDFDEAIKWCNKAAAHGSPVAKKNAALAQAARVSFLPEVTTRDGKPYRNVTLRKVEPDGITVTYEADKGGVGLAKLRVERLPGQLQALCSYTAQQASASLSAFSQLDRIVPKL